MTHSIFLIQGCGGEGHPEDVEGVQDEEAAQGEAQEEAQKEALNSGIGTQLFTHDII